ncbi:MAG TPA: transglycosylase SLT domain-containing protein [Acidobacteriaceae bacterium]|jgi:membrane-bound lytic murein transglycosylase D|nr:transglycosylase SLT domain-containing protein [Acidobacteriaceae bacterium]
MRFASVSVTGISGVAALAALLLMTGCAAKQPGALAHTQSQATAPTLTAKQQPSGSPTATTAAAHVPSAATVQQDQPLIDASQQAYASGVQHYKAGEFQEARSEFDRAVDIYLTSGRDLKADARLNDAFEKLVDNINSLEMDALQQGSGFAEQEAAPVDVANDITFPVDPNLKARALSELKTTQSDLPLVVNDYVASYINYFSNSTKGHNTIVHSLERAGHYHAMIAKVLAEEGVPQDLIYQAVAETGFQPRAVNRRSGAGGMWQFMPSTASLYGLERNGWVDERFDPVKSTHAYARYIKALHNQFGDWYLAMAAYDWGAGYVQKAVQRTGYADFWELYRRNVLPQETKNYVPIILAATIMAKNPTQYGLTDLAPDPALMADSVPVKTSIDLRLVADLVGSTPEEIASLNPSLLRMRTPPDMTFDLKLPVGTKNLFEQRVALIPEDHRDSWRYYIVASGDSLDTVAQRYHVKAAEIASLNELHSGDALDAGTGLVIPVPLARESTASRTRYRARRGDTVVTVADRFGVTAAQLRRWNHLRGNRLPSGRLLYIAQPVYRHSSRRTSKHRGQSASHSKAPSASHHKKTSHRRSSHTAIASAASNSGASH